MCEFGSCEIGVREGFRVAKGDELGMFHFGGSTNCLILRSEANVTFNGDMQLGMDAPTVRVNSAIAVAQR